MTKLDELELWCRRHPIQANFRAIGLGVFVAEWALIFSFLMPPVPCDIPVILSDKTIPCSF